MLVTVGVMVVVEPVPAMLLVIATVVVLAVGAVTPKQEQAEERRAVASTVARAVVVAVQTLEAQGGVVRTSRSARSRFFRGTGQGYSVT